VVLIANDDPLDNFITFIGEDSYKVLQRITFNGTDPNGNYLIANGIEQCAFNPRDGKFYINLPNTATAVNPSLPGVVLRISGEAPFHVEAIVSDFRIPPLNAASIGCGGASGLTVGRDHQIGLACGGANALIIDDRTGAPVSGGVLTGLGGADETWYNSGDNHYFFGISTPWLAGRCRWRTACERRRDIHKRLRLALRGCRPTPEPSLRADPWEQWHDTAVHDRHDLQHGGG
jgi:hypothetical protein